MTQNGNGAYSDFDPRTRVDKVVLVSLDVSKSKTSTVLDASFGMALGVVTRAADAPNPNTFPHEPEKESESRRSCRGNGLGAPRRVLSHGASADFTSSIVLFSQMYAHVSIFCLYKYIEENDLNTQVCFLLSSPLLTGCESSLIVLSFILSEPLVVVPIVLQLAFAPAHDIRKQTYRRPYCT